MTYRRKTYPLATSSKARKLYAQALRASMRPVRPVRQPLEWNALARGVRRALVEDFIERKVSSPKEE